MRPSILIHLSALFSILLFSMTSFANTYYVSPTGSDSNPGTLSEPWRTIARANSKLVAGDTVYIRQGTYNESIKPANSGTPGNPIVYRKYGDEVVTIDGVSVGVSLNDNTYILVDGLRITNVGRFVTIHKGGRSFDTHNTVQNCYMENASEWGGISIYWANYNKLLNNTIKNSFGDVIELYHSCNYNLIKDNTVEGGPLNTHAVFTLRPYYGEAPAKFNVIQDNYFFNAGDDNVMIVHNTDHNLIERNVIVSAGEESRTAGNGLKFAGGANNILRHNTFYANRTAGIDIHTQSYGVEHAWAKWNVLYNNTSCGNGLGSWNAGGLSFTVYAAGAEHDLKDNVILNNILVTNNPKEIYIGTVAGAEAQMGPNVYENNLVFHNDPGTPSIINMSWPKLYTVAEVEALPDSEFKNNIDLDPLFVDPKNLDFHIQPSSPAIDAGRHLTYTIGSGTGTQIRVHNANYFCDGFGIVNGDLMQLQGQTIRARILEVDYQNNTLTVERPLSWVDGQGVSLAYEGSAPDIGAFEFNSVNPDSNPPDPPTGLVILK